MNTNSATPRPCAGCGCDLGYVSKTLAIIYNGGRYEVCGHTNACADRLMARLSRSSTTTTSATNDCVRVFGVAGDLATTEQVVRALRVENERLREALATPSRGEVKRATKP